MSFHVISAAFYGIKWVHVINNLPDPTSNSWVKSLLEAGKRISSKPVKKKDIINTEMLRRLCDIYSNTDDILDIRDLTMIVLGFAGFLRFSK